MSGRQILERVSKAPSWLRSKEKTTVRVQEILMSHAAKENIAILPLRMACKVHRAPGLLLP